MQGSDSRREQTGHGIGVSESVANNIRLENSDINLQLDPRINFASQQNAVPVVRSLSIQNRSDVALPDVVVKIDLDPPYASSWSAHLTSIGPKASHSFDKIFLDLSAHKLSLLEERLKGSLHLNVSSGGKIVYTRIFPIEFLAYNEWSGVTSPPELLAAFVQPNHPDIRKLLTTAREHLRRLTGDPSFSGYQGKSPERVYNTAKAIYQTIQDAGITYINPPASFEETGQKVRTPDQLIGDQMGTCLDLSVNLAAALEQVGIYPFIVTIPGHALVGAWLFEISLPCPAVDDVQQIRKLADLDQLIAFDSSTMVKEPLVSFEEAIRCARNMLNKTESAITIDIHSAREHRIRPLPMRSQGELCIAGEIRESLLTEKDKKLFSSSPNSQDEEHEKKGETASDRLTRWKTKLLDLSLRNRLLNFRETKGTIRLLTHNLATLEDALSYGKPFTLMERPDLMDGLNDPRNAELHRQQTGEDALAVFLERQLGNRRFYTHFQPEDLKKRATELYRSSKLSLEESGTNTLYLSLGFVHWKEAPNSDKTYRAPIVLLPVHLLRKSVTERFRVVLADSEPRINTTFLKKLETEYNIKRDHLSELPEDDAGLDLPLIFRRYREAVLPLQGWDVREEAHLGIFSFTKYLMWLDLEERTEELKENPVVEHLLERYDKVFGGQADFPTPGELEQKWAPDQAYCVLDADSTQLAGVYAADRGQNFVMEGPPGTGKSQTITNIIAQTMANGKSVLFVSEKRAALEVVDRRLTDVGLKEFCLELHSNKANAKEVIRQLGESLEARGFEDTQEFKNTARELVLKREDINTYMKAAYAPREFGESFHDAVVELIRHKEQKSLPLDLGTADSIDAEKRKSLGETVRAYQVAAQALNGEPGAHPWRAVGLSNWNPAYSQTYQNALVAVSSAASKVWMTEKTARNGLLLPSGHGSRTELDHLGEMCRLITKAPRYAEKMINASDWKAIKPRLDDLHIQGATFERHRAEIDQQFDFDAMENLELHLLLPKFRRWHGAFFLLAWIMLFFARRKMRTVSRDGKLPSNSQILVTLESYNKATKERKFITDQEQFAMRLVAPLWKGVESDWDALSHLTSWADKMQQELAYWRQLAPENAEERQNSITRMCEENSSEAIISSPSWQEVMAFPSYLAEFSDLCEQLAETLELDETAAFEDAATRGYIDSVCQRLETWQHFASHLEYWVRYRQSEQALKHVRLGPLAAAHQRSEVLTFEIGSVYDRSFYDWWVGELYKSDSTLAGFYSPSYEETIRKFRELDRQTFALARQEVKARLSKNIPHVALAPDSSEVGILRRELAKKRRHMRIRPLLERLPTLLRTLKPCFLMSPLSVAQYLGPAIDKFDLVLFDEASQIPPWDAIGAIGRGKQVVVVGDSKQLPPTSFFQRGGGEDELDSDELLTEDMESILSECVASNLPRHWLSWHYRSRHEHLIAFSNHHYYQNRLLTFPSSCDRDSRYGVQWRKIPEGVYDHGKSRTNRAEADQIVEEVVHLLKDEKERGRSIGIVTFSQAQQKLIEDLLEQKRAEYPEIDRFFSDDILEPVFVKNLENVQGDERDVVIFSLCYGPDMTGKVHLNFGALNRMGGERRLNVAITRAREQLQVFSTLTPDMIDLSRTRAEGVEHLKTFLAYADRGPCVIAQEKSSGSEGEFDSPFEEAVFQVLADLGWTVHSQVGCSGYRVDLAVVDPEEPGQYVLGIECDGANYHSAQSARDRDRLRQQVLERLGWRIHRIWATDWWKDEAREIEKLEQTLKEACQLRNQPQGIRQSRPPLMGSIASGMGSAKLLTKDRKGSGSGAAKRLTNSNDKTIAGPDTVLTYNRNTETLISPNQQIYQRTKITEYSSDFYDSRTTQTVVNLVGRIVQTEAPVHKDAFVSAVRQSWGFNRGGAGIQERVTDCIDRLPAEVRPNLIGEYYWPNGVEPASYKIFRTPEENEPSPRSIQEIPLEELANGLMALIEEYGAMKEEDLLRSTARLFGIRRLGTNVKNVLRNCLETLVEKGRIQFDGELVIGK